MKLEMDLVRELLFVLDRKPGPELIRSTEINSTGTTKQRFDTT